ncbi:MAG: recombinase family protein [Chthoniobacterales bacterium]
MSENKPSGRAIAYVRMSTEHQQYSTSNQMDTIRQYAARKDLEIIREYSDEGKSGLKIQGRRSLTEMIRLIQNGEADFNHILVYDVSRWGRFQDADESAYYEYSCRRNGIAVHYCAEQFENDGSPVSTIVKSVKRAMAGEYSRELSTKVFQGACRLIQLGFKQGGAAGYGLRRMLVNQDGEHKGVLARGEQKSLQTDRVILVPGPEEEVKNIDWIYHLFVKERKSELEIAEMLNSKAVNTDLDRAWTRGTVHAVLTNEKYIGNNVYHRTSFKLKRKHVKNPPEMWVKAEKVFEGIIEPDLFYMAQGMILARSRKLSNDDMLAKLREVLNKRGRLSGIIIDEDDSTPSSAAYRHRFGSLVIAYQLVGYDPLIDYSFIEENRKLRDIYPEFLTGVINDLKTNGADIFEDQDNGRITLNGELSISIVLCRHQKTIAGFSRWVIRLDTSQKADITIAVRMNEDNSTIRDYYILPAIDMSWSRLKVAEDNGVYLDIYRFTTLEYFMGMAERYQIEKAA